MFIKRLNRPSYKLCSYDSDYDSLVPNQSSWDQRFFKLMEKRKLKGLAFLWYPGWRQNDLNFLSEFENYDLRELNLHPWFENRTDITPLNKLKHLTHLSFSEPVTGKLNFTAFENLKSLKFDYRAGFKSFLDCSELETLYVSKHPFEDLQALSKMTKLKNLQLSGRKLKSLRGINKLKSLERLDILYASDLQNLDGIENCPNLKSVVLFRCGKVSGNPNFEGLVDRREGMN